MKSSLGRILIPILIIIPFIIYMYFISKRTIRNLCKRYDKKQKTAALLITIMLMAPIFIDALTIWTLVILHFVVFAIIFDFINFVITKNKKVKKCVKWRKIYELSVLPLLATVLTLSYGYYNFRDVKCTNYSIETNKSIRDEGYRIALVSDLHFGTGTDFTKLSQDIDEINAENPDIVVLDGDIIDENTSKEDVEKLFPLLSSIKNNYGVFYVYGNHDRAWYSAKPKFSDEELNDIISNSGIHVLSDDSYKINNEFTIIGREDKSHANRKSCSELIKDVDKDSFLLLLDHQPVDLESNSKLKIDLQLSGHTHNGQIFPGGIISEKTHINELNYGDKKIGDFHAIVSSGIAGWGYSIRTEGKSEFDIIDVKRDS